MSYLPLEKLDFSGYLRPHAAGWIMTNATYSACLNGRLTLTAAAQIRVLQATSTTAFAVKPPFAREKWMAPIQ
ncbi:hypothetical protein [Propionivibrio sp.]|uniref:hypothetical protein n=1 Tax=Propionivibrio sp. TaxID=2212460 RepID=UPI003BF1F43C